jgi:hypothetical protein
MLAALSDSANTVIIPPRLVLVVPLKGLASKSATADGLKLRTGALAVRSIAL